MCGYVVKTEQRLSPKVQRFAVPRMTCPHVENVRNEHENRFEAQIKARLKDQSWRRMRLIACVQAKKMR